MPCESHSPRRPTASASRSRWCRGASRDHVVGVLGDILKIAVSKPPKVGAANKAVMALLAEALGVAPAEVRIVQGHAGPRKYVVTGVDVNDLRDRLGIIGH